MGKQDIPVEKLFIRNEEVADCIRELDSQIRAEYNTAHNFLDYFAGKENLINVGSIKNQVIYGRRGTGKTHLLRALQEMLIKDEGKRFFAVYIDMRRYKPLMGQDDPIYYALVLFKEICAEIYKTAIENIPYLYKLNELDISTKATISLIEQRLADNLLALETALENKGIRSVSSTSSSIQKTQSKEATLNLSANLSLEGTAAESQKVSTTAQTIEYISFASMTESISSFLNEIKTSRMYLLIDEWSEIPTLIQPLFSDLLKRAFITLKVTMKIAAIPNRTKLMQDGEGLEDGGDIFGYDLDNRFIYEKEPEATKTFFNELLFNQLHIINNDVFDHQDKDYQSVQQTLNLFLANQALREILIGSAGIPRDFLSIFVNAYNHYMSRSNVAGRISVDDIRTATVNWYEVDKKKAVESNENAKIMLERLINDIIIEKRRCQFLVPEKYESYKTLNDLMDLRVIHLRKRGISHKDNKGERYNVYYIDYACYTSSNIYQNKINANLLNEIESVDDFREIRRVSLEAKFFDSLNIELGNCVKCPKCGKMTSIEALPYIKHKMCEHCFDVIA